MSDRLMEVFMCLVLIIIIILTWAIVKPVLVDMAAMRRLTQVLNNQGSRIEPQDRRIKRLEEDKEELERRIEKLEKAKAVKE